MKQNVRAVAASLHDKAQQSVEDGLRYALPLHSQPLNTKGDSMKRIDSFVGIAPKLVGDGNIQYCLWVDKQGKLFVQLEHNDKSGTFSKLLFSVSMYESMRKSPNSLGDMQGYDIESKTYKSSQDNNNGAFLKAVLNHLLPDDEA